MLALNSAALPIFSTWDTMALLSGSGGSPKQTFHS
jgi:hypothetical protein